MHSNDYINIKRYDIVTVNKRKLISVFFYYYCNPDNFIGWLKRLHSLISDVFHLNALSQFKNL